MTTDIDFIDRRSDDSGLDGVAIQNRVCMGLRSQWFEASQVRLGRTIALKCLRPLLAVSEKFRESFFEAGRQAAVIVHPAALPIINVFMKQNCVAMQWCPDPPLGKFEGGLDVARTLGVGEAVMDCLSSLHATGRCHGNLSPGNVFLNEKGGIWLSDFFQPPVMIDGDRCFVGDRRCMAPEVLTGKARATWASDVFSLGRLLETVLSPQCRAEETRLYLKTLQAEDPSRRGASPVDVLTALKKLRRLDEVRRGIDSATAPRGKRMYRRVPAEFEVSLRRRSATPVETATILMKIRDIGESGVFVETENELLGVGSIVELDFTLKGVEGHVHAFGIVRWRSTPPMPAGVGVQFMEVDRAGLASLRQFLENK